MTCPRKVNLRGFPADLTISQVDVNGDYTLRIVNHNGSPVYKRTPGDDIFIVQWFGGDLANKWIVKQGKGNASFLFLAEGDAESDDYKSFKQLEWKVSFRGRLRPCYSCSSQAHGGMVDLQNPTELAAVMAGAAEDDPSLDPKCVLPAPVETDDLEACAESGTADSSMLRMGSKDPLAIAGERQPTCPDGRCYDASPRAACTTCMGI
eukprot:TRINITY_DN44057_c0_g1_i1.p1 TRINITY_DN44057_c0_g1~~TRINITY_DN44057_c0_g1_i1.p1  ORF type:complete len:207 (+),score=25.31 TRINITY_DN44057_c0_g1_i1:108-728(+)